ncbi:MFS transporter [Oceanibacterium hippocampi]|nr:MFS transporter [Oceanibacterium hippocampi]
MSQRVVGTRADIDSAYAWWRLAVSMVIATVGSVGMWAVIVILPDIQAEFGVDRAGASLPYTMTMIGFAFGGVIVGRYVDRLGMLLPMLASGTSLGLGFILASQTTGIWQFALIQCLLIGIGSAASFGPLIADVSHWFEIRRGIAVGAAASGNYIAGAIWPTIIRGLAESEGWRSAYITVGIVCFAVILPLTLLLRRQRPQDDAPMPSTDGLPPPIVPRYGSLGLSPRTLQLLLAVAGVACCTAMAMPQVHTVAYCADLGYGVTRGAEMLSLMLAGGIVSRLASGFLADYIGGIRTILLGSALQCIALFLYLPFDGLTSLYVVSLIFGLSQGGIVPGYAIIVREYLPAREAGQRVGLVIMATVFGMALGGWMSGWIYDLTGSYEAAFLNGIAWNLLNIGIIGTLLWRSLGRRAVTA